MHTYFAQCKPAELGHIGEKVRVVDRRSAGMMSKHGGYAVGWLSRATHGEKAFGVEGPSAGRPS